MTGRPRGCLRRVLNGIIYCLRTGTQWNRLPREFGSDTTVHDWFQRFAADGVFERLWAVLVDVCDELGGVDWEWQSADHLAQRRGGSPLMISCHARAHSNRTSHASFVELLSVAVTVVSVSRALSCWPQCHSAIAR